MNALDEIERSRITWERAAAIFGNPKPPKEVWERQFDYLDNDLQRLAGTPYEEFDFSDMWYYHHDLAYVELQPDLFAYLSPACLRDWHFTLMRNEPCSHGDSEFQKGLHQGNVLQKMTSKEQQDAVFLFMRDSFLERLAGDRSAEKSHGWFGRLNSVG